VQGWFRVWEVSTRLQSIEVSGERLVKKAHPVIILKICSNQIIRASASANIEPGCRGTYQITVGIECDQKARLIGGCIRFNSHQCLLIDEK
jgi:hypothetical protein